MSFPRYPHYKDSGVEWLGEVPGHWKAAPLKTVSTHNDDVLDESTAPDVEIAYVDISSVDGINGIKTKEDMLFAAAPSRARRRVKHGDVIVSTVRTYLKAIARIRDPEENLIVSTGFAVIRPRGELAPDFLGHLVCAGFFVDQVIARSTGVSYPAINASELVAIPVPIPPLPEQTQIAAFLDRETAKIDGLVAEQRRLMALLKEKRQAVISHAVTRGLNPHAPLKPSGIEWLGDVPEHWDVLKGAMIGTLFGSEQVPEDAVLDEGDLPFIKVGSLSRDSFEIESWDYFVDRSVAANYRPRSGYIVFPKRGAAIFTNKVNIVDRPSLIDPNLMGWQIGERAVTVFIAYALKCRKLDELADVSTVPQINNKHIAPERFAVPPIEEQHKIVAYLNAESAKFDSLTQEAQRAIDLLQERRTALISAAVTGQIDVRGGGAGFPPARE